MTETRYCSLNRLEQGFETLRETHDVETLKVLDTDCILRGVTLEEKKERNITGKPQVASIKQRSGFSFEVSFHQNMIDDDFEFNFSPPGVKEMSPGNYCSEPKDMSHILQEFQEEVENMFKYCTWDFIEIDAASMASGGHFTDYEFSYVLTISI